jgi:hypothetical protein
VETERNAKAQLYSDLWLSVHSDCKLHAKATLPESNAVHSMPCCRCAENFQIIPGKDTNKQVKSNDFK